MFPNRVVALKSADQKFSPVAVRHTPSQAVVQSDATSAMA
jgi:hypothetical protein